jgi:hypothetical protein
MQKEAGLADSRREKCLRLRLSNRFHKANRWSLGSVLCFPATCGHGRVHEEGLHL